MAGGRLTIYHDRLPGLVRKQSVADRREIANQIAGDARSSAPWLTGAYSTGIGVEVDGDTVRVVDNDPDAIHKEYGTSDTPAHASVTNAAMAYGKYSGMKPRRGR